MAKIKRANTKGVRRATQSRNRSANARRAKAKTAGVLDGAMGLLPFTEEQWSRIWTFCIIGAAVIAALFIANLAGVPAMARAHVSIMAADAGFEVRHVRVTGTDRMDEQEVYARALGHKSRSMLDVEIDKLRGELLDLPWVKDARVSMQMPDTLVIDIVERKPHAVLVHPDRFMLIDTTGRELEPISKENSKNMLTISGPGSAKQVAALDQLLAAAPALGPQVTAAEWVGNRRWNLVFKSDQVVALPEGAENASSALIKFARLDGQNRLIGGKVASFDMRNPPRIYMRVPGRSEAVLAQGGTP